MMYRIRTRFTRTLRLPSGIAAVLAVFVGTASGAVQSGTPVGFVETFALAEDRGAVLDQLVAGTDEHDYYSSLHLQQQGRLDEVDGILASWKKRSDESPQYRRIEARQALLRASTDPNATYEFLEEELGLRFDDRRTIAGAVPDLPTRLDPSEVDPDALLSRYLRRGVIGIERMSPELLEQLVGRNLSKEVRRAVLERLPRPDVPGLVEMVVRDLQAYPKIAFGDRAIHTKLTLAQLEQLRGARPNLLANRTYVNEVLVRLALRSAESIDVPEDRAAYLERTWAFVSTLPSAFNSLKAHILFRWLEHDLEAGAVNRERVVRYLQLPRAVWYFPVREGRRETRADLSQGYAGMTPFRAIRDETEIVTESLQAIFRTLDTYDPLLGVLKEDFARRVFAETKLLYGDPSQADRYIEMLGGPAAVESLRDRVEIEFARTNPETFSANDAVSLAVDVKNVETLIVRIFEVDPVAVFDRFDDLRVSSLDLDGLVANAERTFDYVAPPLSRHRETLEFPELGDAGTYLVELIGGGVSSRAVVRKGTLHMVERKTAAGHVVRVLDENRVLVDDAILRFGGRDYTPDDTGEIFVPYTTDPGTENVLLRRGADGAAAVERFDHLAETYELDAGVFAPTEALLAGMEATFTVRPRLTLQGKRIALEYLEDAVLEITSVDRSGDKSSTFRTISAPGEIAETIRVPERTQSVEVVLRGKVRSITNEMDVDLASRKVEFPIERIASLSTRQVLLTRGPEGYLLEVRGRNGEVRPDVEVQVTLRHQDFDDAITERLKSDENGRIVLGGLPRISAVTASGDQGLGNTWNIDERDVFGVPGSLHAAAGRDVRVPYGGTATAASRSIVSLIETTSGRPLRDVFERVGIENRYIVLRGLEAGQYELVLQETGRRSTIEVLEGEGERALGWVVGEHRALQLTDPVPLQIMGVGRDDEAFTVQLGGVTESARVHVYATKFVGPFDAARKLALGVKNGPMSGSMERATSFYESGRRISDEYRYILARRAAEVYPGNMLDRPGYLLNPWVVSATDDQMMMGGGAGGRFGGRNSHSEMDRAAGSVGSAFAQRLEPTHNRTLDFLAVPAATLIGLEPDENGVVRIPIAALSDNHLIRVVAVDDAVTAAVDITGAPKPLVRRDRRLVDPIDPDRSMTQQRRIAFARPGESIEIRDAAGAGAKTYGTLGDVYLLFRAMSGDDSELAKFEFLTRWPSLDAEEKRAKYSELVCHELNVFLREKDPEFFEEIVVPYIANKGHRTFIDDWLLGADLTAYLEPWCFERLNVVEKILLLQATGGDAAKVAADLVALVPEGTFSLDRTFGQVLAAGGLSNVPGVLDASLKELRDKSTALFLTPESPTRSQEAPRSSSDEFFLGRGGGLSQAREAIEEEAIMEDLEVADGLRAGSETRVESGRERQRRERARGFYFRDLAKTKELAETHYWKVRLSEMRETLITASPFWVDFAEAGGSSFVSTSFPFATRSRTEMLLALAFLDLPFEAEEPEVAVEGRSVTMTATSPMLLALEDIRPAAPEEGAPDVLVGQDFFKPEQRTVTVDGVTREQYVTGEFLTGRPYGTRVVVTNPSSASLDVQVLMQVPEGAIPLGETWATKGVTLNIGPYGTEAREMLFYFPEPGTFADYPVHAGLDDVLLGQAPAVTLTVVDELSSEDEASWEWLSQNAELPAVIEFLRASNPRQIDLSKIAWRMAERASFDAVTTSLRGRGVYEAELWRYAVKHRASVETREYLDLNRTIAQRVGPAFSSPLLTIEPQRRGGYEHLAYEPLVGGRTYAFGGARRILNDQFAQQYHRFLTVLSLQETVENEQRVELSYYLLLQDRVGEALAWYDRIDRQDLDTRVQYDYMTAYMAFYRQDVGTARAVAESYATHPVERWRNRFRNVIAQVDEIEGKGPSDAIDTKGRDQTQGALAGAEPVMEVRVEDGRVVVDYERIDEIEVRYHRMDIEFLFSSSPFVRGDEGSFGLVQPGRAETLALPEDETRVAIELPAELAAANVIVEVRGQGLAKRATYFAGDVVVQGLERYGQVRVIDGESRAALPEVYVKVYAKLSNGEVRFHKDGYTDLRGRFDYVSLSGVEGPPVEKYAVLLMHDTEGAKIEEFAPPAR